MLLHGLPGVVLLVVAVAQAGSDTNGVRDVVRGVGEDAPVGELAGILHVLHEIITAEGRRQYRHIRTLDSGSDLREQFVLRVWRVREDVPDVAVLVQYDVRGNKAGFLAIGQ